MRYISLVTLLFLGLTFSFGQQQTLLSGDYHFGGYGAPVVKYSPIHGKDAILMGGTGGVIINKWFVIGGGGYGLVTGIKADPVAQTVPNKTLYLRMGYGGLILEFLSNPEDLVNFSGRVLIGAGGIENGPNMGMYNNNYNYYNYDDYENDAFFVVEPEVLIQLNVTPWCTAGLGASYRLVSDVQITGTSNKDLTGGGVFLTLKFGTL